MERARRFALLLLIATQRILGMVRQVFRLDVPLYVASVRASCPPARLSQGS